MPRLRSCHAGLSTALMRKSRALVAGLPGAVEAIVPWWLVLFLVAGLARMALSPAPPTNIVQFADVFLPYAVIALAPALALRLAFAAFPEKQAHKRLNFHLSAFGKWKKIPPSKARRDPDYGPFGFVASLLVGLLLTVPIRGFEFFLAVPAIHAGAPEWARVLFLAMAFEAAALSFLYVVCFVMALRTVPLFPRMLVAVWAIDICFQLGIAQVVAQQPGLPASVAAPLADLLTGNITKVLVSISVWLPYLLLSNRINLTYRLRKQAT
ncbi:DUF2569 domain-containing protein [Qipengyuania sp. CAU 1752]